MKGLLSRQLTQNACDNQTLHHFFLQVVSYFQNTDCLILIKLNESKLPFKK